MIIILVIQCKEIFKINDDNECDKPKPIISIKNEKLLYSNYNRSVPRAEQGSVNETEVFKT